jgi:replicative DNA helicase
MGKISQQDFRNLARAAAELENLPLYIDDTPGLTIAALRTRARRLKRQRNIGFIVIDYLQLLTGSGKAGDGNRVQEISEISRGLKTLAKELNVPVLALSQLSRAVEQREDKRPQLSDLRESGSIEQDADIVLFVYREDYYLAAKQPSDEHPISRNGRRRWRAPTAGRAHRRQAAPRRHRQGEAQVRKQDHPLLRYVDEGYVPRCGGKVQLVARYET